MVDRDTNGVISFDVGSKEVNEQSVKLIVDFLLSLDHRKVELRCDNDYTAQSLQRLVATKRLEKSPEFTTVLSQGKLKDSPSMGAVESAIRWWRGKFRTLLYQMQLQYQCRIGKDHPMWPWMVHRAGVLNTTYRVRADGATAYFAIHGHHYTGEICVMGETVLMRMP